MNILILDTATEREIIVIKTPTGVFASSDNSSAHAASLFNRVQTLLTEADVTLSKVNALAVGIGPGSFTGIRIAVASARMIAQINRVPIVGIKTHELFAASLCESDVPQIAEGALIMPAFDAKKNRIFAALYRARAGEYKEILEPGDYTPEYILRLCGNEKIIAGGSGADKYQEIFAKNNNCTLLPKLPVNKEAIAALAERQLSQHRPHDYGSVLPFYARKSDAEIAKEKSGK